MTIKSFKNDTADIIRLSQEKRLENKTGDIFFTADLLDAIKNISSLEIQNNETGTTEKISIKDVYMDTACNDNFIKYKFDLNQPFDGENELIINVSKIKNESSSNAFSKYYLYDVKQSNVIAYRFLFKKMV